MWYALFQVISFNLLKVTQGRASDNDLHSICAKNFVSLSQRNGIAFPDVSQPLGNSLDEPQFFRRFLVIIEALHNSYASASNGQQDRSVCFVHPTYNFARVDLEIR
jgi:hypothetical protein